MQLDKQELVELAARSKRGFGGKPAAWLGALLGLVAFVVVALLLGASGSNDFEDVFFYLVIPALAGGLLGSLVGIAVWLTLTRTRIHPVLGAMLGAAIVSIVSAAFTILYMVVTIPAGHDTGSSMAAGFEASWVILVYLMVTLPISVITGTILGWILHRK